MTTPARKLTEILEALTQTPELPMTVKSLLKMFYPALHSAAQNITDEQAIGFAKILRNMADAIEGVSPNGKEED